MSWTDAEIQAALDEVYRPAPGLLSRSMAAVQQSGKDRRPRAWATGVAAFALALMTVTVLFSLRAGVGERSHAAFPLPAPVPQPITRTSAGAQVAWLSGMTQDQKPYLAAIDPSGTQVARLDLSAAMATFQDVWRTPDGSSIFVVTDKITVYSALDGKLQREYSRLPGSVVGGAFSPDGHWLAILLLGSDLQLQVIDLGSGSSQALPVGPRETAQPPNVMCGDGSGGGCASSGPWGIPVFSPDSAHIYTLTNWSGALRMSAFKVSGSRVALAATVTDGQDGRSFPRCAGPSLPARVVGGGQTLVAFCHHDGAVWFFDLRTLRSSGAVRSHQPNPFWLSPIFTPDGHLLYLHQSPGFGDTMQVVDLASQRLLGPVSTPTNPDQSGPLAWLITNAYAGWTASTVPVSPDGLNLYSGTDDGVIVLRVPDLKPLAKLAAGIKAANAEIWVSGNGQTLYVTTGNGKSVVVVGIDGSSLRTVDVAGVGGFIASERG